MPASGSTVFILGILQRSGTNFLSDLLCVHPTCEPPGRIAEDHFLRYTEHLGHFAQLVSGRWTAGWGVDASATDLCRSLGEGLIGFLGEQAHGARIVTKTPSIENLAQFPVFFPSCKLIILIRDGRAVVESGMRSFDWTFEMGIRNWAAAAQAILEFADVNRDRWPGFLIVRYEDLLTDLSAEMRRILAFLELDPTTYDFERAANLPVRGSSELRSDLKRDMHWHPTARPPDFNPLGRWSQWPKSSLERFNWIAGQYLTAFDYDIAIPGPSRRSVFRNRILDLKWSAGPTLSSELNRVRRRLAKLRH